MAFLLQNFVLNSTGVGQEFISENVLSRTVAPSVQACQSMRSFVKWRLGL